MPSPGIQIQTQVGVQQNSKSNGGPIRQIFSGALGVGDVHGRYHEMTQVGRIYTLSTPAAGVTIAAGNVIGAATPIIGIYNPISSGINVNIIRAIANWASGTAGAGGLVWGVIDGSAVQITNASGNLQINNATFKTGGGNAITLVNAAITGPTVSKLFRFFGGPSTGAIAANANITTQEEGASDIQIRPGCFAGLFAAAAGTSPIIMASVTYEETDLLL